MFCWSSEDLQRRLAALEQERAEFLRLKQQLEAEFNQKRAKFKELYLSKEGMDGGTVSDRCSAHRDLMLGPCAHIMLKRIEYFFFFCHVIVQWSYM